MRACEDCGSDLTGAHGNAKRCRPCADRIRSQPRHTLGQEKQAEAVRLARTMTRKQLAAHLGCSEASLKRFCWRNGVPSFVRYSAQLREQVLRFYEDHGRAATQERFPGVKVRSIVERNPHAPRLIRLTPRDILLLVRMAGLVPFDVQARHLARPRAGAGSIRSAISRRLSFPPHTLPGLPWYLARNICLPDAPWVRLPRQQGKGAYNRKTVLWCDCALYLQDWVPNFLRQAIEAMAKFQQWLYQTHAPHIAIRDIIEWGETQAVR